MKLTLCFPDNFRSARSYIAHVIFEEFLGYSVELKFEERINTLISLIGSPHTIILSDTFFEVAAQSWLENASLPQLPLQEWDTSDVTWESLNLLTSQIPILYGSPNSEGRWCHIEGHATWLGLDILGSAFFMLTRYEEYVVEMRDECERFSATSSIAYQTETLCRPLVDEYVYVLQALLEDKTQQSSKSSKYQFLLSHDVDHPTRWTSKSYSKLAKNVVGDLIKRRSLAEAYTTTISYFFPKEDPTFCFDWIMSQSEKHGLRSAFYFLCASRHPYDISYDVSEPLYQKLFRSIQQRGHEIGIHGSYLSSNHPSYLQEETRILQKASNQPIEGGRQHYLRFQVPDTWQIWSEQGLHYDSTLGYADHIGFRCGTAKEFPVFNLETEQVLPLKERPLIVMEHSLLATAYQGLSHQEAFDESMKLITQVKHYGGNFTLLWHNHYLDTPERRELYQTLLQYGV